ncbi:transcription factor S-II-domain-containing protein [Chytriomyces sp. MP71]|nr:transcription factor S-II-domain-containing protein [Chytriomyces sp. MP71]
MLTESEIVDIRRGIETAVKESHAEGLDTLMSRFDGWTPSAEVLRKTRIGLFMNTLRKNDKASDVVRAKANAFTRAWSKALSVSTASTASTSDSVSAIPRSASGSFAAPALATSSVPPHRANSLPLAQSPASATPVRANSLVSPASAAAASQAEDPRSPVEVDFDPEFDPKASTKDSLGDKARDTSVKLFVSALSTGISNADPKLVFWKARQIEDGLCREFHGVTDKYKSQFRTLVSNIKNLENLKLRTDILGGRIDARKMATMSAEDLMSESAKIAKEKAEKEIKHWASTAKSVEAVTDEFKCGKCGKRKATYYQKQTRSADEPMTTFVTCQNCGNKWKFC